MITNDARCTTGIKSRIVTDKAAFNKKTLFNSKLYLKYEAETQSVLQLEHGREWCCNLGHFGK
jgi:hypothetical protein